MKFLHFPFVGETVLFHLDPDLKLRFFGIFADSDYANIILRTWIASRLIFEDRERTITIVKFGLVYVKNIEVWNYQ
jgi:hypothetical protein